MSSKFLSIIGKIFIISLIAIIFTIPVFADVENNNTIENAEAISVNTTVSGNLGGKYDDVSTDRYDYYKIVLPSDGRLDVTAQANNNLELSLSYLNSAGVLYSVNHGYDGSSENGYSVYGDNLEAGTYYIKVFYKYNEVGYSLTTTFTSVSEDNDIEDNDTKDTSNLIGVDSEIEGHIGFVSDVGSTDTYDYYKVELPSDGRLDVEAVVESDKNIELTLSYESSGGSLYSVNHGYDGSSENGYNVYGDNLEAGTYYIKVFYKYNATGYTLTNTFTPVSQGNDIEDNNTKDMANIINVNTETEGHIGFISDSGSTDNYDYYKITIPSDGKLDVYAEVEEGKNIELSLSYESSGGTLYNVSHGYDGNGDDGYNVYGDDLEAGTYYIKIFYKYNATGYILTTTFNSNTDSDILVTNITLNNNSIDMEIGDTKTLVPSIYPSDATDKAVTWSSSDISVATVEDGLVTAVGPGSTVITVSSSSTGVSASCTVNVAVDTIEDPDEEEYTLWTGTSSTEVAVDKKWTIAFNKTVDGSFVNNNYFYVRNSSGENVTNIVQAVSGDFSKIEVVAPQEGYTPGNTYTLYIEGDILAEDGSELSEPIKMEFTIEGEYSAFGQATLSHRGFDFSEGEFRSDEDGYDAEFDNRKDGSIIFWEPVEAGDEGRGEYVWIECPDEELNENIVADMGAVSFESVTSASEAVFEYLSPELLPGHVYIVKTLEGGYAKIQVISTDPDTMTADVIWSYSLSGDF